MKIPQNSQSQISQDKNSKNEDLQNKNSQNKNSKNPNEIDISALNDQNLSQKDFSVEQLEKAGVIVKIKIGKMTYIVAEIAFFLLLAILVMLAILADKSQNSTFLIFSVVMIFFTL